MTYTNAKSVPWTIYESIVASQREYTGAPGCLSVTGLLKPPWMRMLEDRAVADGAELVRDASMDVQALLGTALDAYIKARVRDRPGITIGSRMEREFMGRRISGEPDLLEDTPAGAVIIDIKKASTYSHGKPDKLSDWRLQLSGYAWLLSATQRPAGHGEIHVFWSDWSEGRAGSGGYPAAPAQVIRLPLLSEREYEDWLAQRLGATHGADAAIESLGPSPAAFDRWGCSKAERWDDKRCAKWCSVADDCPHGREVLQGKAVKNGNTSQ